MIEIRELTQNQEFVEAVKLQKAIWGFDEIDLLPVRLSARNAYLQLDDASEQALSPQRHVDRLACPLIVAAAEFDAPEFRRQARDFAAAAARAGAAVRHVEDNGFNHFDFIDTLADAQGLLGRLMFEQMEL